MTIRVQKHGADAFAGRVETFTDGLKKGGVRTAQLMTGPTTELAQEPEVLRLALEELRAQHEELIVAEEELRAQLDELARMGNQLEAERERYTDLFERAPDAFLVTDRSGIVRDANGAAVGLFGIEARFLRGKPLFAFVDPDEALAVRNLVEELDVSTTRLMEIVIHPRGSEQVRVVAHITLTSRAERLLWILRPVGASRMPSAAAVGARDLTRALRDKEELLGRETRAREELERMNRAKDRFIAVLAHDLRAPLNAILGWTQLLRREVLDDAARTRALETVERNAMNQAKLIDELLDISRISADRVPLALAWVDLAALTQRVVEGSIPKAQESGIALTFTGEPGLTVVGDQQRLEQVLTNLLANALKYTPSGERVEVRAKRVGVHVQVSVRDTGSGISPELLPKVFDMYTQDRTYSASRQGLGLGLYIVRRFVELHDGTVSAHSEGDGRGATFTISLPLRDERVETPVVTAVEAPGTLRAHRILVVDDELDSRELMVTILRRAGAEVASAASATAALELFVHWTPDVVVSDVAMPDCDGCELVAKLRAIEPNVAALAVSGFTAERDAESALRAGFDVHIGKPFDAGELVKAVAAAARSKR